MLEVGSFVALGDSFTEGFGDPGPDGGWRGWADRFAEVLAQRNPDLRYANLAVRGKLLGQVIEEQLPGAIAMAPDLVSLAAGGNDLLRPRADPDLLAGAFDDAVLRLRTAGIQVLLFTGFDPRGFPLLRMIRARVAVLNMHLRIIAQRRGCLLVDLWTMRVLTDPRLWTQDRLHLTADGHRRVALRACEAIGLPAADDWREPLPGTSRPEVTARALAVWLAARQQDVVWARRYAVPWVHRRLRGVSSGDGLPPKRPELTAI
jgi:lysophospholipase L1-like esterase